MLVDSSARFMLLAMWYMQLRVAFLPFVQVIVKAEKPSSCPKRPTTLGQHLKKRRMELGLLQKEVAERLGLDECTIGNWEKDRTYPAVRLLRRLIHYLGYSPFPKGPTLAEQLRATRAALGLSRKRLASLIGIDEEVLTRIEWGIGTPTPRLQALVETFIAQALAGASE